MKYIFEVNRLEGNTTEISVSIQDKNTNLTPRHIISASDENPTFFGAGNSVDSVLKFLLDDVRLTVSERIDAEANMKAFLDYIKLNEDDVTGQVWQKNM